MVLFDPALKGRAKFTPPLRVEEYWHFEVEEYWHFEVEEYRQLEVEEYWALRS